MSKKNTDKIISMAKTKTEVTKNKVIDTVNKMLQDGEKITFYSVYKNSGVSKSFVYNNDEIRLIIETYRRSPIKRKQSKESKDVIIETQKKKILELERLLNEFQKTENYKEKYEKLLVENEELRKQLKSAYEY